MNKEERKFATKLIDHYEGRHRKADGFSSEENIILERWRALKIINEDAFVDATSASSQHKEFLRTIGYPFTLEGYNEYTKNKYIEFREGIFVTVVRDVLTVIAFSLSLYLTYIELIAK